MPPSVSDNAAVIAALDWPAFARPSVAIAVQAPLVASGFDHVYRSETHALHLHDYDGTIRLAGAEYRLTPGTLTWSPAGLDSSYDLPRPGTHWCVHFHVVPADVAEPSLRIPILQTLGPRAQEGVGRFVNLIRLRAMHASAEAASKSGIAAAMSIGCQELIAWAAMLSHIVTPGAPTRHPTIDKLTDYIDRHLHRPIRVANLVDCAGFTQNYLARLFRRHTGSTMPAYVLGRRMALANLLLTTTDLPIKQVALRVGIRDAQQFNKLFRRHGNMSPTEARAVRRR